MGPSSFFLISNMFLHQGSNPGGEEYTDRVQEGDYKRRGLSIGVKAPKGIVEE